MLLSPPSVPKFLKISMHFRHFNGMFSFQSQFEGHGLLKLSRFAHYWHFGSCSAPAFLKNILILELSKS